jgi:hypothetical protein
VWDTLSGVQLLELKAGNVEVRVVSRADAPFLHGKAGIIRQGDGTALAFMGSLNETREGWPQMARRSSRAIVFHPDASLATVFHGRHRFSW